MLRMPECKNGCGKEGKVEYDGFCDFICKGGFQMRQYRDLD